MRNQIIGLEKFE